MAPVFTYDHYNCMPRNFIIGLGGSEAISVIALIFTIIPMSVYFLLPNTQKRLGCCLRIVNKSQKVENIEIVEENSSSQNQKELNEKSKEKTVS